MTSKRRRLIHLIVPLVIFAAAAFSSLLDRAFTGIAFFAVAWPIVELVLLTAAVFSVIHHADVIAHRTGEPYGTLVLTVAVTVIEVALIVAIMLGPEGSPTLVRDTVFAVIMIVCNGLVGLCLVAGGLRFGEQGFQVPGARAYLVVIMPLATLSLILPSFTTSVSGPYYAASQLAFVSIATLVLYAVFLYVQTIRHRDYFLSDSGDDEAESPSSAIPPMAAVRRSAALLIVGLIGVVLVAKHVAGSVKTGLTIVGGPIGLIGVFVAILVLLPEGVAALRAARRDHLQKALNLALGSSLATIGLTIPAVAFLSVMVDKPLALGLEQRDMVLLILTFAVSLVTFAGGRTNILPGFVHLVLFATFVFLIFAP